MNKNILRKLTLSAVTLGVAAISATTSTFAWFTTNGSADASNVSGQVSSAGQNMLIKTIEYWKGDLVSGTDGSSTSTASTKWSGFSNSVTLKAQDGVSMQPVTYSSDTTNNKKAGFKKAGSNHTFDTEADTKDVLHYQVVFAITDLDTTAKTVKAKFTNFSGSDGSQYLLVDAYDSTVTSNKAEAGKTIKVNLLDVLSLRVENTVLSSSTSTKLSDVGVSESTGLVTAFETGTGDAKNYRYKAEVDTLVDNSNNSNLNGDAITYYNNIYGLTDNSKINAPNSDGYVSNTYFSGESGIELFKVKGAANAKTAYVLTDFYFYIDGWDKQCFNCVGGTSLSGGTITFTLS